MIGWRCRPCYDMEQVEEEELFFEERKYSTQDLAAFQSQRHGKYIKSSRIFSAEIECYYSNGKSIKALEEVADGIGYTGDGSLETNGIEFQTPKLKGANGEQQLRALCTLLQRSGYSVDKTTGLHVHLDGKGLIGRKYSEPVALKQLWYFYRVFDDVILSFLPRSRRANHYCKATKEVVNLTSIKNLSTLEELERVWYRDSSSSSINYRKGHKYDNSRYAGINLHPLLASRHLEIRFHGGTLNAVKILEWVSLHQRIADLAGKKKLPTELLEKVSGVEIDLETQTKVFFELLDLPNHTKKYFEQRQKTFARSVGSEGEELEGIDDKVSDAETALFTSTATN